MSMTVQPTDCSAATAARWNIGPDTRLSRPTTIRPSDFGRLLHQAPNPAAYCTTISGVSASPTRPRIPDTLTINPSFAMSNLEGLVGK
jgi:hypothetical protein